MMFEYEEDEDPMELPKQVEEIKHHSTDHSGSPQENPFRFSFDTGSKRAASMFVTPSSEDLIAYGTRHLLDSPTAVQPFFVTELCAQLICEVIFFQSALIRLSDYHFFVSLLNVL
uniref:Uncharacterized protein n=2 Tax=Caenorhabditis japonica TaxID=281687 RepID=A0A8R1E4N8_CAEJA